MSKESWLTEFYPVPAKDCPAGHEAEHSLRKWRGLTKESLARHEVEYDVPYGNVEDQNGQLVLEIDSGSCALCCANRDSIDNLTCETCVLRQALGGTRCSASVLRGGGLYERFANTGDPLPMISALERAVEIEAGKRGEVKV